MEIEKLAKKYPKQIERIRDVIRKNHELVEDYYGGYFKRYKEDDPKEQLRILFVETLNSNGGGNINDKAKSIRSFESKVENMKGHTYEELLKVFKADDYSDLFEKFKSKDYPQMGEKKSALFLRNILYFKDKLVLNKQDLKKEFRVPIDRVIIRTVNSIFKTDYKKDVNEKSFKKINSLAKKIFKNEPILLEDLWFWGRFYRCKEKIPKKDIPYCEFNKNLLIVDANVTKEYREKLLEFAKKHPNCLFREICSNPF